MKWLSGIFVIVLASLCTALPQFGFPQNQQNPFPNNIFLNSAGGQQQQFPNQFGQQQQQQQFPNQAGNNPFLNPAGQQQPFSNQFGQQQQQQQVPNQGFNQQQTFPNQASNNPFLNPINQQQPNQQLPQQKQQTQQPQQPQNQTQQTDMTSFYSSNAFLDCTRNCLTTLEYNPVCGTDQVPYTNERRLECANSCGQNLRGANWQAITILRRGACSSGNRVA